MVQRRATKIVPRFAASGIASPMVLPVAPCRVALRARIRRGDQPEPSASWRMGGRLLRTHFRSAQPAGIFGTRTGSLRRMVLQLPLLPEACLRPHRAQFHRLQSVGAMKSQADSGSHSGAALRFAVPRARPARDLARSRTFRLTEQDNDFLRRAARARRRRSPSLRNSRADRPDWGGSRLAAPLPPPQWNDRPR